MDNVDLTPTGSDRKFFHTSKLSGTSFLDAFCIEAKTLFDANTVSIASLGLVESEHLFIEAISSDLLEADTSNFCSSPAPCAEVLTKGQPFYVCRDVGQAYPKAEILTRSGSEAYLGLPLQLSDGTIIGVFALDWLAHTDPSKMQRIIEELSPYLPRISEELNRKTTEHILPALVSSAIPLAATNRINTFHNIAAQAAALTKVKMVSIVHRVSRGSSNFRVLTMNYKSKNLEEFEGELLEYFGIPCANMLKTDLYMAASGVVESHPDVQWIQQLGLESYLGFGFRDSEGETIGHIAFLHDRPMRPSVKDSVIMQVIASRAGQELQRYELERQRDQLDASLRVRSKLESLGTMAGTIAHDFNNQLTAIIGNTELAGMVISDEHPAKEYLTKAEQSMWRARDVIAEIMDFAGNAESAPLERVALGEVVSSAISEFEPRLIGANRIISEIDQNIPDIESRRIQVFQILSNLIANGLDALVLDVRKDIKVAVRKISLSDVERAQCLTGSCSKLPIECVCVELNDQGRGMSPETIEHIFDPYFSTKGVSRGLGLSSVLGTAKRLGIGMTCRSEIGVGTTFRLFFEPIAPIQAGEVKGDGLPKSPTLNLRKTALVVDDEESVSMVISRVLDLLGWDVVTACSGEQALLLAQSIENLDLVFVDVVMPGISGFETLTELRKTHTHVPAVIVSGYSEENLSRNFQYDNTTKFLIKPFSTQVLRAIIDDLLQVTALG